MSSVADRVSVSEPTKGAGPGKGPVQLTGPRLESRGLTQERLPRSRTRNRNRRLLPVSLSGLRQMGSCSAVVPGLGAGQHPWALKLGRFRPPEPHSSLPVASLALESGVVPPAFTPNPHSQFLFWGPGKIGVSGGCEATRSFSEAVTFLSQDDHLPRRQPQGC